MDARKTTIVAIIAILVGLLVGWLYWGSQSSQLDAELSRAKASLTAQAEKAASQEKAMTAKLQEVEAQLKQLTEQLAKEKEARGKLQTRAAKGKK